MNCSYCNKPIILVPSAKERAAKYGKTAKHYEHLFTHTAGVHKARIKAYKALNNVEGIEPVTAAKLVECVKPDTKPKTDEGIIYTHIDGLEKPLPVKAKTIEICAVLRTSEKAIQVVNSDQYTAWIPKSVIITSERNKLFIQLSFDISWYKSFTQ